MQKQFIVPEHKTVPVKPLKLEIIHLILLHLTRYSQREIYKIDMTPSLSSKTIPVEKNKNPEMNERKKLLLGLEKNFKTLFFEELPAISAPYLNEHQKLRGLPLPKYTLKNFSHLDAIEWKKTVQQFMEDNQAAIDKLPKWLHAWFFRSEMEKLSNKTAPKERQTQAINTFYYLLYKSDYLKIKGIERMVYRYASNNESEMFALFTDITGYIQDNHLTENIFYTHYLRKVLNSTSQNQLLYSNSEMEKNATKELILQKNQEIELLSIKLQESQNFEIMEEMNQLKPALEIATEAMNKAKLEIEKLKSDMQLLQKDITFVTEEKNELQQKCSNLLKENEELKQQKEALEIKLQEAELRFSRAEKEIYFLKSLLNEPNKKITSSVSLIDFPEKNGEFILHSLNHHSSNVNEKPINSHPIQPVPLKYGPKIFDSKQQVPQPKKHMPINDNEPSSDEEKKCVIF